MEAKEAKCNICGESFVPDLPDWAKDGSDVDVAAFNGVTLNASSGRVLAKAKACATCLGKILLVFFGATNGDDVLALMVQAVLTPDTEDGKQPEKKKKEGTKPPEKKKETKDLQPGEVFDDKVLGVEVNESAADKLFAELKKKDSDDSKTPAEDTSSDTDDEDAMDLFMNPPTEDTQPAPTVVTHIPSKKKDVKDLEAGEVFSSDMLDDAPEYDPEYDDIYAAYSGYPGGRFPPTV